MNRLKKDASNLSNAEMIILGIFVLRKYKIGLQMELYKKQQRKNVGTNINSSKIAEITPQRRQL